MAANIVDDGYGLEKTSLWAYDATTQMFRAVLIDDATGALIVSGGGGGSSDVAVHDFGTPGNHLAVNAFGQLTLSNDPLHVDGKGVAGTPSGGVLSVQGVAGGTAAPVSGPLTDAQLRATAVPTDDIDRAARVLGVAKIVDTLGTNQLGVDATNRAKAIADQGAAAAVASAWPIKIVDAAGVNVAAVAATNGALSVRAQLRNAANADLGGQAGDPVGTETKLNVAAALKAATTAVSATGIAAAGVTLTIPSAGASLFNYLTFLELVAYNTAARTGGVTPVLVASTGISGTPTFEFSSAGAVGTIERYVYDFNTPLKGSAAATAMTFVAPATTSVIWRINAFYYTGS